MKSTTKKLALFSAGIAGICAVVFSTTQIYTPSPTAENALLLAQTNSVRQSAGLAKLSYSDKLAQAAEQKALDMLQGDYWSHNSPAGATPWEFIKNTGYQYQKAGENLARNIKSAPGVIEAWQNSPSHRQNLLSRDYSEAGFATKSATGKNGQTTTITVALYAKPSQNLASFFSAIAPTENNRLERSD